MRRNLPQPLDTRVLHWDVGIEALGDGAGDEGGALLLEQLDQPLFLRHQHIDPRRLPIEKGGDGALLGLRRGAKSYFPDINGRKVLDRRGVRQIVDALQR